MKSGSVRQGFSSEWRGRSIGGSVQAKMLPYYAERLSTTESIAFRRIRGGDD